MLKYLAIKGELDMKAKVTVSFDEEEFELGNLVVTSGMEFGNIDIELISRPSYVYGESFTEEDFETAIDAFLFSHSDSEFGDDIEFCKILKSNPNAIKDCIFNAEEVYFTGEYEKIRDYLDNNKEQLSGKKIILDVTLELDADIVAKLKNVFVNHPNILIMVDGNTVPITLDEYEKTVMLVDEIVNKIKRYNYSPLEAIMHIYDLIRDRVYVPENAGDGYYASRDLTSVLLGDKIVCVGYVNIFNTILRKLNISCMDFSLASKKDQKTGHSRSLVYLKDDKYGIDGLYFFDPTFDSKKDDQDNGFLNSYLYFAKSFDQVIVYDGDKYIYHSYEYFDPNKIYALDESLQEDRIKFTEIRDMMGYSSLNQILNLVGIGPTRRIIDVVERGDIICQLYEVSDLANKPIDAKVFVRALYNVRKNEYYENPTKYAFDMDVLTNILVNSKLETIGTVEEELLKTILGRKFVLGLDRAREIVDECLVDNGLDVDMEKTKVARTLRLVLEKKKEEESLGK